MSKNFFNNNFVKIHFSGIGGASMSALAKYLLLQGYTVSGSDIAENGNVAELKKLGAKVYPKHTSNAVRGADAMVYTSAINFDNPELKYATKKKIPLFKRSQLLGHIVEKYSQSIAVSGSHGKTTATAMIANTLIKSQKDPTVFLGGESLEYGNLRLGKSEFCVLEACEYKKNFLDINAKISLVLNIDKDHVDCYKDINEIKQAFKKFIDGKIAVLNADDVYCRQISHDTTVTFGIEKLATYMAKSIKFNGKGYSFTAYAYGNPLGRINLSVIGKHNIYNALATIAVCDLLKIPFSAVKSSLESFSSVKRRCEFIGNIGERACFADYAHHPKEITAIVNAFKELGEEIAVVFQPHTYSRTKALMNEFVKSLSNLQHLILYPTYPAREQFDGEGSAKTLFDNVNNKSCVPPIYAVSPIELKEAIANLSISCKKILFLGAGDIYQVATALVNNKNI